MLLLGALKLIQECSLCIEVQAFKKRAAEIADHAHNPRGALDEGAEFLRGLDEAERQRKLPVLLKAYLALLWKYCWS